MMSATSEARSVTARRQPARERCRIDDMRRSVRAQRIPPNSCRQIGGRDRFNNEAILPSPRVGRPPAASLFVAVVIAP
jgi:hypothetical protein